MSHIAEKTGDTKLPLLVEWSAADTGNSWPTSSLATPPLASPVASRDLRSPPHSVKSPIAPGAQEKNFASSKRLIRRGADGREDAARPGSATLVTRDSSPTIVTHQLIDDSPPHLTNTTIDLGYLFEDATTSFELNGNPTYIVQCT